VSLPDSCKTDTGKPPFKASEGGRFENLRVSEDITPSEFQQGKGTRVPIRPKVRLEAFPNVLPMSVSSKVYATLRFSVMIMNYYAPTVRMTINSLASFTPQESPVIYDRDHIINPISSLLRAGSEPGTF